MRNDFERQGWGAPVFASAWLHCRHKAQLRAIVLKNSNMAAVRGAGTVERNEMSPKKQRKELRSYKNIPLWLCEYHQEVLPYIYRAIGSKFLPFSGITLLHFDSHPDLMAPLDLQAESVFHKELLFDVVSIADWILPAVYAGHIKKIIWIKPPWSRQISDKILCFNVGRHKVEGTIR